MPSENSNSIFHGSDLSWIKQILTTQEFPDIQTRSLMTLVQGWYLVQMSPRNKIHQLLSHPAVTPRADTPEPILDTQTNDLFDKEIA